MAFLKLISYHVELVTMILSSTTGALLPSLISPTTFRVQTKAGTALAVHDPSESQDFCAGISVEVRCKVASKNLARS